MLHLDYHRVISPIVDLLICGHFSIDIMKKLVPQNGCCIFVSNKSTFKSAIEQFPALGAGGMTH